MSYFSQFYQVEVRESIIREFTNSKGEVDDMLAGLHEVRVRMAEKRYDLKELEKGAMNYLKSMSRSKDTKYTSEETIRIPPPNSP